MRIPAPALAVLLEMMFRAAATEPPIVVLGAESITMPSYPLPKPAAVTPSAARPMMLPAIRVPAAEA